MSVSSVFVKTPVHNGLSTMPIEFRVVQEHRRAAANAKSIDETAVSIVLFVDLVRTTCKTAIEDVVRTTHKTAVEDVVQTHETALDDLVHTHKTALDDVVRTTHKTAVDNFSALFVGVFVAAGRTERQNILDGKMSFFSVWCVVVVSCCAAPRRSLEVNSTECC